MGPRLPFSNPVELKLNPDWRDDKEQADEATNNDHNGEPRPELNPQTSPRAGNGLKSGLQREDRDKGNDQTGDAQQQVQHSEQARCRIARFPYPAAEEHVSNGQWKYQDAGAHI